MNVYAQNIAIQVKWQIFVKNVVGSSLQKNLPSKQFLNDLAFGLYL